jgi:hypothetical protein
MVKREIALQKFIEEYGHLLANWSGLVEKARELVERYLLSVQ